MDCLSPCCLNNRHLNFENLCDRDINDTTIRILKAKKGGIHYRLEYSPLGSEIEDPQVVLCGITPGHDSWQLYLKAVRSGITPERAAIVGVYSNMRVNMFKCLHEIGLFKYLSYINEYWVSESYEYLWDGIFKDEYARQKCGLQLTQACNCAILRNRNSEQPSESALNEIVGIEPRCLFNRLRVRPSTKLIIFWGLGRKLDQRWRKSCFYDEKPRTILLPHPSGSNRSFNNLDLFMPQDGCDSPQLRNAKISIQNGKKVISELIKDLSL